jgi:hypothetical protein
MDPRFRPTLWPGTVVPTPPLHPFREVLVRGDWITWPAAASAGQPELQLPQDFYLRELLELQADDMEAAAQLIRSYGLLFDLNLDDFGLPDFEPEAQAEFMALAHYPNDNARFEGTRGGVHRDLVKLYIERAQRATNVFLACQSDGGLEDLVSPNLNDAYLTFMRSLNPQMQDQQLWPRSLEHLKTLLISEAILDLQSSLDAALSNFSIGSGGLEERRPTIYSVSFLQLYNHLAEGATARICANETCLGAFVRQRGRAEYNQHRTVGVKYCSRECARAQAQRQLRRRAKLAVV